MLLPQKSRFILFFIALQCLILKVQALEPKQVQTLLSAVIATSQNPLILSNRLAIQYTRVSISEELSEKGEAKTRKEKTYRVYPLQGAPYHRLVQVNGVAIPVADQDKKQDEDLGERGEGKEKNNRGRDFQISSDIFERFVFTFDRYGKVNGRRVVVLQFKPRSSDLPIDNIMDRVINKVGGSLTIDTEDKEIVSADIRLLEKVTLWGGLAGNLEKFNLHLTKTRLAPGLWINEQTFIEIAGRKLFSSMRLRVFEHCKDFQLPQP